MREIKHLKRELKKIYRENNIDNILSQILNIDIKDLYINKIYLSSEKEKEIKKILKKFKEGTPLPYLLKRVYFNDIELFIEEAVFIPRPETEIFALETVNLLKEISFHPERILDLGCGSGCIGLLMKKFFPKSEVFASDISIKACRVSKINSKKTNLKINIICTDMFSCFNKKFDLLISNPPYVKEEEFENLPEYVKKEPKRALYAGKDGLVFYRKIAEKIKRVLKDNGIIAIEIHPFLEKEIKEIFKNFTFLKEIYDLNGFKRGLIFKV